MNNEMQLSEVNKKKLEKLANFADKTDVHQNLPIYEELCEINETLRVIAEKPDIEIPSFPEIPEQKDVVFPETMKVEVVNPVKFPEMPKVDLTQTNSLLQKLVDREDKPVDISVSLKIE